MRIICRASLRWNGQVRIEPMIARQADFVWWAGADMKAQLPMGLQLVHQTLLCRVKCVRMGCDWRLRGMIPANSVKMNLGLWGTSEAGHHTCEASRGGPPTPVLHECFAEGGSVQPCCLLALEEEGALHFLIVVLMAPQKPDGLRGCHGSSAP